MRAKRKKPTAPGKSFFFNTQRNGVPLPEQQLIPANWGSCARRGPPCDQWPNGQPQCYNWHSVGCTGLHCFRTHRHCPNYLEKAGRFCFGDRHRMQCPHSLSVKRGARNSQAMSDFSGDCVKPCTKHRGVKRKRQRRASRQCCINDAGAQLPSSNHMHLGIRLQPSHYRAPSREFPQEEATFSTPETAIPQTPPQVVPARSIAGCSLQRLERISRTMARVLRHDSNFPVRSDGYCQVKRLLQYAPIKTLGATTADIEKVVAGTPESGNLKQRFQLAENNRLVRAAQGFSRAEVDADEICRPLGPDEQWLPCYHGSYMRLWPAIKARGLIPGGHKGRSFRRDIHFSTANPCSSRVPRAASGISDTCNLVIALDLKLALREGILFHVSENGVILSPGNSSHAIPPKYFAQAWDYSCKVPVLLWQRGKPAVEQPAV